MLIKQIVYYGKIQLSNFSKNEKKKKKKTFFTPFDLKKSQ